MIDTNTSEEKWGIRNHLREKEEEQEEDEEEEEEDEEDEEEPFGRGN